MAAGATSATGDSASTAGNETDSLEKIVNGYEIDCFGHFSADLIEI
jgi:hypothetical protein